MSFQKVITGFAAGILCSASLYGQVRYSITDEFATGPTSPKVIVLHDASTGAEVAVAPARGGELSSFKVTYKGQPIELIYHARDYVQTDGFQGKGPLLWPAVGAQYPVGTVPKSSCGMGTYSHGGKTYSMPCHGFAQNMEWHEISRKSDDRSARVTIELSNSESTSTYYPFKFQLDATYVLSGGRLAIDYVVKSDSSNDGPMPFSIGNHLAFKTPFIPGSDPGKMLFETQNTIQLLRNAAGVLSGEQRPRSFYTPEPLESFDAHIALPLAGYQSQPFSRLIDPQGMTVRVTQTSTSTPPGPFIRTNLYGSPKAGYICPEPWFGVQNSLNTGIGLIKLAPGTSWTWRVAVEVEPPPLPVGLLDTGVERVGAGFGFVEGPVWVRKNGGYLLVSDIFNSRAMKWVSPNQMEIYRRFTHAGNGNAMDSQGRLYTAERDGRRVLRTNADGTESIVAEKFEGKRLNAPNDVVVRNDGEVYFTDPDSAAVLERRELDFKGVYHVNQKGEISLIAKQPWPNGIALTKDGRTLYVADSQEFAVYAYDLDKAGNASNGRVVIRNTDGSPDGLRVAANGNLYIACKGIAVYSPKGVLLKTISVPETPSNVTFGGDDLKTLYIAARTSIYRTRIVDEGW